MSDSTSSGSMAASHSTGVAAAAAAAAAAPPRWCWVLMLVRAALEFAPRGSTVTNASSAASATRWAGRCVVGPHAAASPASSAAAPCPTASPDAALLTHPPIDTMTRRPAAGAQLAACRRQTISASDALIRGLGHTLRFVGTMQQCWMDLKEIGAAAQLHSGRDGAPVWRDSPRAGCPEAGGRQPAPHAHQGKKQPTTSELLCPPPPSSSAVGCWTCCKRSIEGPWAAVPSLQPVVSTRRRRQGLLCDDAH